MNSLPFNNRVNGICGEILESRYVTPSGPPGGRHLQIGEAMQGPSFEPEAQESTKTEKAKKPLFGQSQSVDQMARNRAAISPLQNRACSTHGLYFTFANAFEEKLKAIPGR